MGHDSTLVRLLFTMPSFILQNLDTPLIAAAYYGNLDTVRLLVDKGAALDMQHNVGLFLVIGSSKMITPTDLILYTSYIFLGAIRGVPPQLWQQSGMVMKTWCAT